jgi:hypothetical protein
VSSPPDVLEHRIDELRTAVRRAVAAGDPAASRRLRAELRAAEREWDAAVARLEREPAAAARRPGLAIEPAQNGQRAESGTGQGDQAGQLLPIREQVHQALTLLGVPAAPRLIVSVHDAFFSSGPLVGARLTSLRRDEERSFRTAPYARAYYLCCALTAELLAPARGLLAVSTWPLERRVIGPLSPRVDYLLAAIAVADGVRRVPGPGADALRLLWRFAVNIPGAQPGTRNADPELVSQAAQAELEIHREADAEHRRDAAARARSQLDDAGQLFGSRLRLTARSVEGA